MYVNLGIGECQPPAHSIIRHLSAPQTLHLPHPGPYRNSSHPASPLTVLASKCGHVNLTPRRARLLHTGIPTLASNYLPEGVSIELQSENGLLGMGPYPEEGKQDPDLINAGRSHSNSHSFGGKHASQSTQKKQPRGF